MVEGTLSPRRGGRRIAQPVMIDFAAIKADFPLIDIVGRYAELRRKGSEYVALCPFHDDHNPSFAIYEGSDGYQRYRCFSCGAGSEGGDVIDFIAAIEQCKPEEVPAKLHAGGLPPSGVRPKHKPPRDEVDVWEPIVPAPDDAPEYDPAQTFNPRRGRTVSYRPSRLDTYWDAQGRILCHVVRLDFDDGEKICPTITYCEGPGGRRVWAAKRMKPPYPLQGLDDLQNHPKDAVVVVSGEKCRERLAAVCKNFVAVTWLGGDQSVGKVDVRPLKGRYVTYWPDADASSKKSMMEVHNMLAQIEKAGTG